MPTHWESSERPLFVRTVVVNGNRHAILSQVDPLCQARKTEGSCHGYASPSSIGYLEMKEGVPLRRVKSCYPLKRDISSDLQNCLVKLRVVLTTQEQKKKNDTKDEDGPESGAHNDNWKPLKKLHKRIRCTDRSEIKEIRLDNITGFQRGNSYCSMLHTKENDDCCYQEIITEITDNCTEACTSTEIEFRNIPEMANGLERNNLMHKISPLSDSTEEILKNYSSYFFPIVYIKSNHTSWNNIAKDNYVSKNSNNPLSERVLQWLELAQKRKQNQGKEKAESNAEPAAEIKSENLKKFMDKIQNRKYKSLQCKYENMMRKLKQKCSQNDDEDVEEEVKQESDIETVLSSIYIHEYPKYSKELNKRGTIKTRQDLKASDNEFWINSFISIPEKITSDFSITEQLKESILSSFETTANLENAIERERKAGKKSLREKLSKAGRRKGLLMKQTKIRISSDEEDFKDEDVGCETQYGKKKWESKKRFKYQNMASNDENEEPSDESSRDVRILYNEIPLSEKNSLRERGGRRLWVGEKGFNRPQLHIFMPGIDPKYLKPREDSASDTEGYST